MVKINQWFVVIKNAGLKIKFDLSQKGAKTAPFKIKKRLEVSFDPKTKLILGRYFQTA